ncbi:hypothetical protein LguiB_030856 [Lonicera macranthoides]
MNCKLISRSEPSFILPQNHTQSSTTKSSPLHFPFKTRLPKTKISIKTSSGSFRTRTNATINKLYATSPATETFYELLGISETVTLLEIKRAYKQLALKYHPDVSPVDLSEEYTRNFIRVQEAYETLSDPQTRALYDIDLSKGLHLAFSSRNGSQFDQRKEEKGEWMNRWQSQLMELKRKCVNRDSSENVSWGAQMRRQRSEGFVNEE